MQLVILASVLLSVGNVISSTLVPVPGVGYRPKECVHEIPSGSIVTKEKDGSVTVSTPDLHIYSIPPCESSFIQSKQPRDKGWIAYASYGYAGNFSSFNGTWKVPTAPTTYEDQILYFFTGLTEQSGSEIIQPVLQYGKTPDGGGEYWEVACWWVNGAYLYSKPVTVQSGDTVFGYMNTLSYPNWELGASINGGQQQTNIIVSNYYPQVTAYVTLEAYQMTDCKEYPSDGSITFTDLVLDDLTPTWTPTIEFTDCNHNVESNSPTSVTISY